MKLSGAQVLDWIGRLHTRTLGVDRLLDMHDVEQTLSEVIGEIGSEIPLLPVGDPPTGAAKEAVDAFLLNEMANLDRRLEAGLEPDHAISPADAARFGDGPRPPDDDQIDLAIRAWMSVYYRSAKRGGDGWMLGELLDDLAARIMAQLRDAPAHLP